ncbi:Acg family FMN-binding oxidoreductase [Amycolatopsis pithecellobii]|uniref:Nitroreductase n=1 Tax=Amycolatopsis pithecellobii TaxID=664692 RepID=A0A6N7Z3H0_9PSEU|nr:nitroreductase family protein [Amycolatopsis pithecellobii]MTD54594.1 nitroreductase [Amycolatopsis pithecellobii]
MSGTGLARGPLVTALEAAVWAPSPHNTQPWYFEVDGDRVAVFLDPRRVLAIVDPEGREARLSCGAAILNMRVALRAAGRRPVVHLLPDRAAPECLAVVQAGALYRPTPVDAELARAIVRRRSNRRPFADQAVPPGVREALIQAARKEGADLVLLNEPASLDEAAALLRRAEHLQSEDPAFQDELSSWTTDSHESDEGVPVHAGGPRPPAGTLLSLRQYGNPRQRMERPYEPEPLVVVLGSFTDTPLAHVRTGQALQRVLLTAASMGVSASFLSQPIEMPATRTALRELVGGHTYPQAMLRLGYGYPSPPTGRRPAEAVTRRTECGSVPTSGMDGGEDR